MNASLDRLGLKYTISAHDLESNIRRERQAIAERARVYAEQKDGSTLIDLNNYQPLDEIMAYMDQLEESYNFVSSEEYGRSYEDRPLRVLKVCKDGCGEKPIFFI